MQVIVHTPGTRRLAEFKAMKLAGVNDVMALMLHARIHRCDGIILDEIYVSPEFFRLESGLARQVLETLHNNRYTLAIVGDISRYTEVDAVQAFVRDANRSDALRFYPSLVKLLAAY